MEDSCSAGCRQEDISMNRLSTSTENANESTEEDVPKILSPELRDVFHHFANMLDAKSFMKLAMTCKDIHKQCMEDKSIKINVDEKLVKVYGDEAGAGIVIRSSFVSERHLGSYLASLRKQLFNVTTSEVRIDPSATANYSIVDATRNYLKNFGVNRIKKLEINDRFSEWEAAIILIKDFHVNTLHIWDMSVPLPILHSLLQLDLDEIVYCGENVPIDFVLGLESSPIRKIQLTGLQTVGWSKFMQLLWKIQSGTLKSILVNYAVVWEDPKFLEFDHKGELPDRRPLIFQEYRSEWEREAFYVLHWQGGVTKCRRVDVDFEEEGEYIKLIYKCPDNELPPVLRKDEDVLKDLAQMVPKVACYFRQFRVFISGFKWLVPEGRLPSERPLYFKTGKSFVKLTEDEKLMECAWNENYATWTPFERLKGCPALAKLMFDKILKEENQYFYCEDVEEFDSWLEDYRKVDFEHLGPLPVERPLIFAKRPSEEGKKRCCVILDNQKLLQCELRDKKLSVDSCKPWNRPPVLIDANCVKEVLQKAHLERWEGVNFCVELDTFLNGYKLFKRSRSGDVVDFKKTQNIDGKDVVEIWLYFHGLCKFFWRDGRGFFSNAAVNEIPFEFIKESFKACEQVGSSLDGIVLDLEQFNSCLESFEKVPFDYNGPLPKNSPFAFVKEEIRHSCSTESNCNCSEVFYRVWLLSDGVKVCYCTWGAREKKKNHHFHLHGLLLLHPSLEECNQVDSEDSDAMERRKVVFDSFEKEHPPILKSKTYLRTILEKSEGWYSRDCASLDEFLAFFKDYTKISPHHKGALPEERPLLVERDSDWKYSRYLLLKNGTVVKGEWIVARYGNGATFQTILPFMEPVPSVFMSALL